MKTSDFLQLSGYRQDMFVANKLANVGRLRSPTFLNSMSRCLQLAKKRPEPWTLTRTAQKDYIFQLHGDAREGGSTAQGRHENGYMAVLIGLLRASGFLED